MCLKYYRNGHLKFLLESRSLVLKNFQNFNQYPKLLDRLIFDQVHKSDHFCNFWYTSLSPYCTVLFSKNKRLKKNILFLQHNVKRISYCEVVFIFHFYSLLKSYLSLLLFFFFKFFIGNKKCIFRCMRKLYETKLKIKI